LSSNPAELCLGELVRSASGRDKGRLYFIVGKEDARTLLLADGDSRPLARPKKKNFKHVTPLDYQDALLADKLANAAKVTNRDLREALAACLAREAEGTDGEPEIDARAKGGPT